MKNTFKKLFGVLLILTLVLVVVACQDEPEPPTPPPAPERVTVALLAFIPNAGGAPTINNVNGVAGAAQPDVTWGTGANAVQMVANSQTVNVGERINDPQVNLVNHELLGWYILDENVARANSVDADGLNTNFANATAWNFATDIAEDNIILIARFRRVARTITFAPNGTNPAPTNMPTARTGSPIGEAPAAAPADPARVGFTFAGWEIQVSGAWVAFDWDAPVARATTAIALRASWTPVA